MKNWRISQLSINTTRDITYLIDFYLPFVYNNLWNRIESEYLSESAHIKTKSLLLLSFSPLVIKKYQSKINKEIKSRILILDLIIFFRLSPPKLKYSKRLESLLLTQLSRESMELSLPMDKLLLEKHIHVSGQIVKTLMIKDYFQEVSVLYFNALEKVLISSNFE